MNYILIEKQELLIRHNQLLNLRFPTISFFLGLALFLKIFLGVSFTRPFFFLVSFMLLTTLAYAFIFDRLKIKSSNVIIDGYFAYMLFDLIVLSVIIYLLGGMLWIGFIFYFFYLYINFLIFSVKYCYFLAVYSTVLYFIVIIAQYVGVYPNELIFSDRSVKNIPFLITTGIASMASLWIITYYGSMFYKLLQGKIEELQAIRGVLEDERASLEIKVKGRTKELWDERRGLEKRVRERTKELEEERQKLSKRILELERFHKTAVDRELKMRELKKEIFQLKEALKNFK